ncbi:nuclear transport factor 2 family protein [Aurantiacibacter sp. MUD61]|uniref:nuclear transport factor 2 family protein n=1 Tax=Aurantiacibacter sp. MUD61 TaxID=3009083 RepID=UPI0022F0AC86|nr:nuclear transport factor 2 family protein [Aurantiacibacter sp. MUD61]
MRKFVMSFVALAVLSVHAAAPAKGFEQRSPEQVIASATAAYQARDRARFVAHFADDAIVDANGFTFQGRAQIAEAYAQNFRPDAPTVRVVDREAYANRVIDTIEYTERGQVYCCTVTAYFVEDGQITYARVTM